MSLTLRTGLDYLMAMPIDELNDLADDVVTILEKVEKHGQK